MNMIMQWLLLELNIYRYMIALMRLKSVLCQFADNYWDALGHPAVSAPTIPPGAFFPGMPAMPLAEPCPWIAVH